MKALALLIPLLSIGAADFTGLHNGALRAALHSEVRSHAVIPYSSGSRFDTSDALRQLDAAPNGPATVRLVYSGLTLPADSFGLATGWNREHLWPNSYGLDDVEPAYSDLHNLRACDANVNSSRGNKWYDLSSPVDGAVTSPAHVEAPGTSADPNSWQPREDERGDLARALFYMDVRYEGGVAGEPDLQLVEDVTRISSSDTLMGRLSVLFRWNLEDPPDDRERARNAAVAALQGKGNPFVDDPDLVARLWLPQVMARLVDGRVEFRWEPTGLPVVMHYAPTVLGPWTEEPPAAGEEPPELYVRLVVP